eukprot:3035714-Pyramimonas_sp.AAC.1
MDQGVASHLVGLVFWCVISIRGPVGGGSYAARVAHRASHLKDWCATVGVTSNIQRELKKERIKESLAVHGQSSRRKQLQRNI